MYLYGTNTPKYPNIIDWGPYCFRYKNFRFWILSSSYDWYNICNVHGLSELTIEIAAHMGFVIYDFKIWILSCSSRMLVYVFLITGIGVLHSPS